VTQAFAAVDLGASAGRVMLAAAGPGELKVTEVSRFANLPVEVGGTLHWDILGLYRSILDGLREADAMAGAGSGTGEGGLTSVGVDSWGVDYGLLDETGALLGNPVHYRDHRTDGVMDRVLAGIPAAELYATTGIQLMPINTIFQLAAAAGTPQLREARTLLLIPDLIGFWLTGTARTEITNASTTQLLDIRTGDWAWPLVQRLGLRPGLFSPLQQPGDLVGLLRRGAAEAAGLSGATRVIAVGSHDTASAVVAVPAATETFAYISSGTWSLAGLELGEPVLSEAGQRANFTNERGVDGTVRYLRNVMGLWLLQETMRGWDAAGHGASLEALLREAAQVRPFSAVVDANDPAFLPPGDMPARIADACRRTGQAPPSSRAEVVRCILDSLALAYRETLHDAMRLSGRAADAVHIVGGGARNELLCQLTADACGLPVVAGPAEAAGLGNVLVQARAAGAVPGDLAGMRRLVRSTQPLRQHVPQGGPRLWEAAARRVRPAAS
jgi:rhamnulokinase